MKRLFTLFGITLALALSAIADDAHDLAKYKAMEYQVRDLALIYQGGSHRIPWTEDQFEPYITHVFADGTEDWIFDGYLFIEFTSGSRQFTPGYGQPNARKQEWETYLKNLFRRNRALSALDAAIESKKATLGEPPCKHKVALTCFVPIEGQTDWGEIDGKALDFNNTTDRLTAVGWFIDELVARFYAAEYDNLELYGIYMIAEDTWGVETLPRRISTFVKKYDLDFLWIPYFKARGYESWKGLKYDIAYLQPGHFFSESTPDSRLDEAVELAKKNGMAMEYECDERALSQKNPSFRYRMDAYTEAYERHGIWYDTPVAYYTGNHMFLDMFQNPSTENSESMDRLCRHIVNRRVKTLDSGIEDVFVSDEAPVYYNLQGIQVAEPTKGIFIEKRGNVTRKIVR